MLLTCALQCPPCAGTALGDPIEVNAATSVLLPAAAGARRPAPLALMASKSWSGHGEPAAGLVALLHASTALGAATVHPVLHLRALKPYIAGILDQAPAGSRGTMAAGRQAGPLPAVSEAALAGVSSFAFMGTNAHAVLRSSPPAKAGAAAAPATAAGQLAWRRSSCWAGPAACLLAEHVAHASGGARVVLQARLGAPQLAYLWQHRVAGRAIFPGAGYLEMVAAAARALGGDGGSSSSGGQLLLARAAIPAPLLLPGAGEPEGLPLLEVALEPGAGSARVQSLAAAGGGATVHLAGSFCLALQQVVSVDAGEAAASAAAGLLLQLGITKGLAAAPVAGAAAQVARGGGHNDGAQLDVGAYDSWLQLGQVFIQGAGQLAAGVYVPSGLEALQMPLQQRRQGSGEEYRAFVLPRPQGSAPAATAISDYWLADGGGGAVCAIQGMQARSIAAAGQAGGEAAAAAEQAQQQLLYEVAWLAAEPEAAAAAAPGGPLQLHLAAADEQDSTAAAISVVQQLLATGSAAALAASGGADVLQPPQGAAAPAASAAVLGMLRTAALEAPELQLSARTSAACAGLQLQAGAAALSQGAPDAFGAASQAAVSFQPRLLPAQAARAAQQFQLLPRPRGALDALVPVASDLLGSPVPEGQALVSVKAVGLNFRDVLNVLGGWRGAAPGPASAPVAAAAAGCCPGSGPAPPFCLALPCPYLTAPHPADRRHVPRRPRRPRQRLLRRGGGRAARGPARVRPDHRRAGQPRARQQPHHRADARQRHL